jgi:hypothetical protein
MGGLDLSQHSETAYAAAGGYGEFRRRGAHCGDRDHAHRRVEASGGALNAGAGRGLIHPPVALKVGGLFTTQHRRSRA